MVAKFPHFLSYIYPILDLGFALQTFTEQKKVLILWYRFPCFLTIFSSATKVHQLYSYFAHGSTYQPNARNKHFPMLFTLSSLFLPV